LRLLPAAEAPVVREDKVVQVVSADREGVEPFTATVDKPAQQAPGLRIE